MTVVVEVVDAVVDLVGSLLGGLLLGTGARAAGPEALFPDTLYLYVPPADGIFDYVDTERLAVEMQAVQAFFGRHGVHIVGVYPVAALPAPGEVGRFAIVSDAASAGDCTVGGSPGNIAFCRDTGSAWATAGGGFGDTNGATICADDGLRVLAGNGTCPDLNALFATINHTHAGVYALATHIHDDRYFTEAELSQSDGSPPNSGPGNRVHWDNIVGMPVDILDGDQVGAGGGPGYGAATGNGGACTADAPGAILSVRGDGTFLTSGCTDGTPDTVVLSIVPDSLGAGQLATNACGAAELAPSAIQAGDIEEGDLPNAINPTRLANGSVSATEYQTLDGVTSGIQNQLNSKADGGHVHDSRYYQKSELDQDDGTPNQGGDPVAWTKVKGIPSLVLLLEVGPVNSGGTGYRLLRVPNGAVP